MTTLPVTYCHIVVIVFYYLILAPVSLRYDGTIEHGCYMATKQCHNHHSVSFALQVFYCENDALCSERHGVKITPL